MKEFAVMLFFGIPVVEFFKAQFRRLDKAGNGHLEEEDLMADPW